MTIHTNTAKFVEIVTFCNQVLTVSVILQWLPGLGCC